MEFFKVSDAEYAQISAKLEESLALMSFSDSDSDSYSSVEEIKETPYHPTIFESDHWKRYIEAEKKFEQETELIQQSLSEDIKSLREATATVELPEIEIPKLPIPVYLEEDEDIIEGSQKGEIIPVISAVGNNESTSDGQEYESVEIESQEEDEEFKQKAEISFMTEEDLMSRMIEDWFRKEAKMKEIQRQKEEAIRIKREQEKERERIVLVELQKKREQDRILEHKRREQEIRDNIIKREQEKKRKLEEDMKKAVEEIQRKEEMQNQMREGRNMSCEDEAAREIRSKARRELEEKNLRRESIYMKLEDELSYKMRKLIPYKVKRTKFLTFQDTPIPVSSKPKPAKILIKLPIDSSSTKESFKSSIRDSDLPLPTPIFISSVPVFSESPDTSANPLSSSLPYPINPNQSKLQLKYEEITGISGLGVFRDLQILVLSLNKIKSIQNLPPTLKLLDISQNLIESIPNLNLPYLENLNLDMNKISRIQGINYCINLRYLSLNNNLIDRLENLQSNTLLERLSLYRNQIREIPAQFFVGNRYLQELDVGRNKIERVNFLKPLKLLKSLVMYKNKISIVEKMNLPMLQELRLNGNSLQSIDFIENLPMLEILRLEDNNIQTVQTFYCPLLREMNVSFNSLDNFQELLNIAVSAPLLKILAYNDNPFSVKNTHLLYIFNEILLRHLTRITELNNEPRTSIHPHKPVSIQGLLLRQSYESHLINQYSQRERRNHYITDLIDEDMKLCILQQTVRHYNQRISKNQDTSFETRGIEYYWYKLKEKYHIHNNAALFIQAHVKKWIYRRKKVLQRYEGFGKQIVKIQAVFRGYFVRKEVHSSRYDVKKIIKIQAAFRGYSLRKKLKQALEKAKLSDSDLEEFEEVNIDNILKRVEEDVDDLVIPSNIDIYKYFNPEILSTNISNIISHPAEIRSPVLPPIKPASSGKRQTDDYERVSHIRPYSNDRRNEEFKLPSLVPPKPKKDAAQSQIEDWHFTKLETKETLQRLWAKKQNRKGKNKQLSADEKLERFRKIAR
jgi:Leucine-rich repeat (LRR) protein